MPKPWLLGLLFSVPVYRHLHRPIKTRTVIPAALLGNIAEPWRVIPREGLTETDFLA